MAPLVLFDRPYLQDFANHLSRVEIALAIADPALASVYERLPLRPGNAAFDAVVLVLAPWIGALEAARLFLLAGMVAIATGSLMLRRAFNLPLDHVAVAALPFLYSASFAYGFMAYLLGLGLALHAMALWVRAARWNPATRLVFVPIAAMLIAIHYYAFAIFAIFAAAETLHRLDFGRSWRRLDSWVHAALSASVFVPALLWLLLAGDTGRAAGPLVMDWNLEKPLEILTSPMGFGSWYMGVGALAAWVAIMGPAMMAGGVAIDRRAAIPAAALGVTFLLLPHRFGDLYVVDTRILSATILVLLAGICLGPATDAIGRRLAASFIALASVMALALSWLWLPAVKARQDVLDITAGLPAGSRLFWSVPDRRTASWVSSAGYGLFHAASHAAAPRRLLVSTTFALPNQHPLRFSDPALRGLGNLSTLSAHELHRTLVQERGLTLQGVMLHFDYALLFGPASVDEPQMLPVGRMRLMAEQGGFRLFAIQRADGAAGGPAAP